MERQYPREPKTIWYLNRGKGWRIRIAFRWKLSDDEFRVALLEVIEDLYVQAGREGCILPFELSYPPDQVAKLLNVDLSSIQRLIEEGVLRVAYAGSDRISLSEIERIRGKV